MTPSRWTRRIAWSLAVLALAAVPAAGSDDRIASGADLWITAGSGLTFSSFAADPVPADFFCPRSEPFSGKVSFQGKPLASEPAGSLGTVDTIVHRLDDATFDARGEATTRIRLLALSLAGAETIETSCGRYEVSVALAQGEQPTTTMKIVRTSAEGGTYHAPLALDVRVTFEPVAGNRHGRRELVRRVELGPGSHSVWTYQAADDLGAIRVDTDGDSVADAALPGPTNFLAGVAPVAPAVRNARTPSSRIMTAMANFGFIACPTPLCPYYTCHCTPWEEDPPYDEPGEDCTDDHMHCTWVCASIPGQECASISTF
jgi:hypothetical protein